MRRFLLAFALLSTSLSAQETQASRPGRAIIDSQVEAAWKEAGLSPVGRSTDAEFLRRVTLDIAGTIPTLEEAEKFLADTSSEKRTKLIDDLLASEKYAANWGEIWADTLVGHTEKINPSSVSGGWLQEQFAKNTPHDAFVRGILTATGSYEETKGQKDQMKDAEAGLLALYYKIQKETGKDFPMALTGRFTRIFMGRQIQCAQCHDHPFDKWTQEDFYGMASFFTQVQVSKKKDKDKMEETLEVMDRPQGTRKGGGLDLAIPDSKKGPIKPAFLETKEKPNDGETRRAEFARMLTATSNLQFARAAVNRMWNHFFARGIVQPFDDFNDRNKPSHPQLIDQLAREFQSHGFDNKWLIREIANSKTYQLTSKRSGTRDGSQEKFYPASTVRALTPEQIVSALVTASFKETSILTPEFRAAILKGFRYAFGDDEGSEKVEFEGSIPAALMLMNGDLVSRALDEGAAIGPNGKSIKRNKDLKGIGKRAVTRIDEILKDRHTPEEQVKAVFLSTLSRYPTEAELSRYTALIREKTDEGLKDAMWTLLNSSEFLFNH